jgi:lysozyme
MKLNSDGIKLMHLYEGLRLEAYLCPAKVWTIGYGNTFYEDGTKVKKGDVVTEERAYELFHNIVSQKFEGKVKKLLKVELNDNQYSALISFVYNVGLGNFSNSTLLKMVNKNPNNPFIREQFMLWNKVKKIPLLGLTRRRIAEANLYFKK